MDEPAAQFRPDFLSPPREGLEGPVSDGGQVRHSTSRKSVCTVAM